MSEHYIPPEARGELSPNEVTSVDDITQLLLTFRKNNGIGDQSSERAQRVAALEAKREIEGNDPTAHFFGVKDGDKMIATAKLNVRPQKGDEKVGYLSFLSVDEEYRGRGLAKQLTDVRIERARREGCTHIGTDVFTENPIALVTKFNDGYALTSLEYYGNDEQAGRFMLSKKIDDEPEYDKKEGTLGELQELELSDLAGIKGLLDQSWVGIDVKNIGDPKDNSPKNWKLILEKTTK